MVLNLRNSKSYVVPPEIIVCVQVLGLLDTEPFWLNHFQFVTGVDCKLFSGSAKYDSCFWSKNPDWSGAVVQSTFKSVCPLQLSTVLTPGIHWYSLQSPVHALIEV